MQKFLTVSFVPDYVSIIFLYVHICQIVRQEKTELWRVDSLVPQFQIDNRTNVLYDAVIALQVNSHDFGRESTLSPGGKYYEQEVCNTR